MAHEARLAAASKILSYTFHDVEYLSEALLAAGATAVAIRGQYLPDGNKRLAQLGDAVLKTVLLQDWYESGGKRVTGNNLVSTVASNTNLATAAQQSGLKDCIVLNRSQAGLTPGTGVLTATVEAVIGAVWMDSGNDVDMVRFVMGRLSLLDPSPLPGRPSDSPSANGIITNTLPTNGAVPSL